MHKKNKSDLNEKAQEVWIKMVWIGSVPHRVKIQVRKMRRQIFCYTCTKFEQFNERSVIYTAFKSICPLGCPAIYQEFKNFNINSCARVRPKSLSDILPWCWLSSILLIVNCKRVCVLGWVVNTTDSLHWVSASMRWASYDNWEVWRESCFALMLVSWQSISWCLSYCVHL